MNFGELRNGDPNLPVGDSPGQPMRSPPGRHRSAGNGDEGADRPAKRRRVTVACTHCRLRKSRCDGQRPKCSACSAQDIECVYTHSAPLSTATASKEQHNSLELRLEAVERHLQGLSGRVGQLEHRDNCGSSVVALPDTTPDQRISDALIDEDEPQSLVGSVNATDGIGSIRFSDEENAGFFGPSSNIAFTRDIVSATTSVLNSSSTKSVPTWQTNGSMHSHVLHVSRPPSVGSDRYRGAGRLSESAVNPFDMPPPQRTLELVQQYFSNTNLLFPYIHRESFLATYHELAESSFSRVRRSWLGLLNMILAMSISASDVGDIAARQRRAESGVFFHRAMALCEKQIRFGASLEIVQFLLLMTQYLQGTESSVQTWNVHGLAVKASYQLGLHSKHALDRYDPLEREMRLRVWYTCVILDRTLSMTLGRPSLIPETHVRVDRPRKIRPPPIVSPDGPIDPSIADASLDFYNANISLYMIMGRVIDVLYGSNLGCDSPQDVFSLASQVLQIEQQLSEAQRKGPLAIRLIGPQELVYGRDTTSDALTKFRVVYTLRYHNLRILTHRPLLHRYLEILSSPAEDMAETIPLNQVGINSLRTCVDSAGSIVELMARLTSPAGEVRELMGAWWFSLFYTFNAALVLYSGLLIQAYANTHEGLLSLGDIVIRRELLPQAIQCLMSLDKDNPMTEKCARYTSKLDGVLGVLDSTQAAGNNRTPMDAGPLPHASRDISGVQEVPELFDFGSTPSGLDLSEFMVLGDLDFLNAFDKSRVVF